MARQGVFEHMPGTLARISRRKLLRLMLGTGSALVASLAAACAPSTPLPAESVKDARPTMSGAASPEKSATTAAPVVRDKIALKLILHPNWGPTADPLQRTGKQSTLFTQILPEYRKNHPNVDLEIETLIGGTEGRTKYLLQCRQGTQGDVIQLDGFWIAEFGAIGCTRPLDDLIPADLKGDYFDPFLIRYKDKIHGLIPGTAFNSMLWYRKDWFEEAGLKEPPKDWEQLREYAKLLTKVGSDGQVERYGLAFPAAKSEVTTVVLLGFYWQGETTFVTPDNRPAYVNQTAVDIFHFMSEIYKAGHAPKEAVNMLYEDVEKLFYAEKAAMILHGSFIAPGVARQEHLKGKVGLAPNPVYPRTGKRGTNAGGWGISITTKDETKIAPAWDFIYLFAGGNKEFAKGIVQDVGYLPVWKSLADDPIFKKSEWDEVILSELPHARTRPAVEIYPDASLDFTQAFQEVLAGQKDPQQALKDAEERTLKTAREKGYLTG